MADHQEKDNLLKKIITLTTWRTKFKAGWNSGRNSYRNVVTQLDVCVSNSEFHEGPIRFG